MAPFAGRGVYQTCNYDYDYGVSVSLRLHVDGMLRADDGTEQRGLYTYTVAVLTGGQGTTEIDRRPTTAI